jgi:hypothetical protein
MWDPQRLTILWASMACYRNSFLFTFTFTFTFTLREHKLQIFDTKKQAKYADPGNMIKRTMGRKEKGSSVQWPALVNSGITFDSIK